MENNEKSNMVRYLHINIYVYFIYAHRNDQGVLLTRIFYIGNNY